MRVIFERMAALADERVGLGDLGRFTEVRWDRGIAEEEAPSVCTSVSMGWSSLESLEKGGEEERKEIPRGGDRESDMEVDIDTGEVEGGEEASLERKDFMPDTEKTPELLRSRSALRSLSRLDSVSKKVVGRA